MRYSLKTFLLFIAAISATLGAYVRGAQLLGPFAGILFAGLMGTVAFVVLRTYFTTKDIRPLWAITVAGLLVAVMAFLYAPGHFHPKLQQSIDGHQVAISTSREIDTILDGDARFSDLRINCRFDDELIVSVHGNFLTEDDLLTFRTRMLERCEHINSRWLYWHAVIVDTNTAPHKSDLETYAKTN